MNNISAKYTRVTVGGQVFEIPSEKTSELISMLSQWQSISVTEASNKQNPPPAATWNGVRLINE